MLIAKLMNALKSKEPTKDLKPLYVIWYRFANVRAVFFIFDIVNS